MKLIYTFLNEEKKRNEYMLEKYENELLLLPRGKITPRITKTNTYYYLKYRNGKKVCAKYIGTKDDDLTELIEQLERRKIVEGFVKELKKEQEKLKKMEAIIC